MIKVKNMAKMPIAENLDRYLKFGTEAIGTIIKIVHSVSSALELVVKGVFATMLQMISLVHFLILFWVGRKKWNAKYVTHYKRNFMQNDNEVT
mmetsp:Transcript_15228/g.22664  ORF Transcript_15228/g.22664 Transcript_15228/m.22664 type:complete len:93 (-) Transcript_15228:45-323(-)